MRERVAEVGLATTLGELSGLPIQGIEFCGLEHVGDPHDAARLLDDHGLACVGGLALLPDLEGDALQAAAEAHLALGADTLLLVWLPPERRDSEEAVAATVDRLHLIHDRVRSLGLRFGYHNHDFDVRPLESGRTPWEVMTAAMPSDFLLEYDVGNAVSGGEEPVAGLHACAGRRPLVHLKESSRVHGHGADLIGDGDVPWPKVLALLNDDPQTEWMVVEHEHHPSLPPVEVARQNVDRVHRMLSR